jgi:hypothetical protein
MFQPLLDHHQVYCLCLGTELVFLIRFHVLDDYITCDIMLGNKTLGIIYLLVQLCWYICPLHHLCRWMAILH